MSHALSSLRPDAESTSQQTPVTDRASVTGPVEGLEERSRDVRGRYPTWSGSEPRTSLLDTLLVPTSTI